MIPIDSFLPSISVLLLYNCSLECRTSCCTHYTKTETEISIPQLLRLFESSGKYLTTHPNINSLISWVLDYTSDCRAFLGICLLHTAGDRSGFQGRSELCSTLLHNCWWDGAARVLFFILGRTSNGRVKRKMTEVQIVWRIWLWKFVRRIPPALDNATRDVLLAAKTDARTHASAHAATSARAAINDEGSRAWLQTTFRLA
jgi:hypothetical protein